MNNLRTSLSLPLPPRSEMKLHNPEGLTDKDKLLRVDATSLVAPNNLPERHILVDADIKLFKASSCLSEAEKLAAGGDEIKATIVKFDKAIVYLRFTLAKLWIAGLPTEKKHLYNAAEIAKNLKVSLIFSSRYNFRNKIYDLYKGSRSTHLSNNERARVIGKVDKIRATIKNLGNHDVVEDYGMEADDVISTTCQMFGPENVLIVSTDKDFKTLPCTIFNDHDGANIFQTVGAFTAQRNKFIQCIAGDRVDGYSGIPQISADEVAYLADTYMPETFLLSEPQFVELVVAVYEYRMGNTIREYALKQMQCAHLLRPADHVQYGEIIKLFGEDRLMKIDTETVKPYLYDTEGIPAISEHFISYATIEGDLDDPLQQAKIEAECV